jgi:hypothetical protein
MGSTHARFGKDKWKKIYEAKGDFSVIGVDLKTDAPVTNFEAYVRKASDPIIHISLLNDTQE